MPQEMVKADAPIWGKIGCVTAIPNPYQIAALRYDFPAIAPDC
jgi:hypothetical protein